MAIQCLRTLGWLAEHRRRHRRLRESWLSWTRKLEDGRGWQTMFFIRCGRRRALLPVTPVAGQTRRREARASSTILLLEILMSPVNLDSAELRVLIWLPDWAPWMPTIWSINGPPWPAASRELLRASPRPWAPPLTSPTANLSP